MPFKILIIGAGISGLALAHCLSNPTLNDTHNYEVTVIERAPTLRATGLQIDLRGPGIDVLHRMGLAESFRKVSVPEQGLRLVDRKGRSWGYFGANRSGKGVQSFTSDWEIMRGDFCRLLYEACEGRLGTRFVFGVHAVEVKEIEDEEVEVVFSDGKVERFDIVVGADGLWSKMRRMLMRDNGEQNQGANPGFHPLGVLAAYGTIEQDMRGKNGYYATAFMAPGSRGIMTRRHRPDRYQAYAFCRLDEADLKDVSRSDLDGEKRGLVAVFQGAGWESHQIIRALVDSEDLYTERMGVVTLDAWSRSRCVLVGDAAYCPSAMTGMGTTCGLVGAYVLAGEIARHCAGSKVSKESITAAFKSYEEKLRPWIEQVQKGLTDSENYMDKFPSSSTGIAVIYWLFWIASLLRLDIVARWVLREDTNGWALPEYSELDGARKN
jgi:2-polyprenyl-6-methoxyphenol hydroxylase-like FAD-dependent oxidoreductase